MVITENPVQWVTVEFWDSDDKLLGWTQTDEMGYYSYFYKHKGKGDTFTVKIPYYGIEEAGLLKANKIIVSEFQVDTETYGYEEEKEPPASTESEEDSGENPKKGGKKK